MRGSSAYGTWWARCRYRRREALRGPFAVLCLLAALLLSGCSAQGRPAVRPGRAEWMAVASWYGPDFDGRTTASGETYDMNGLTAAHRSLPFGTRLRITNTENGKSVVVLVNDRGPYVPGRDLDLSYGAARAIDMVQEGVARVRVQRLR